MENKNKKPKQNKEESIWRDKHVPLYERTTSSGVTFKAKKVRSG